jgi:hypothetical protein
MFKLKKYDNYIPIGYNCFTSMLLVNLGLRKSAYPLDWVISNPIFVLQYFKTKFENYFLPSPSSETNYMNQRFDWFKTNRYSNKESDIQYNEKEMLNNVSLYEENKLLFDRRINRLLELLETTKDESVLFVYTGEYRVSSVKNESFHKNMVENEDMHLKKLFELNEYIKITYPLLKFDILIIYVNKNNKNELLFEGDNIIKVNINIEENIDEINRKNITEILRPLFL